MDLFNVFAPRARATDPASSHAAAAEIEASGAAAAHRAIILAAVRAHPGRTSLELAGITGLDRHAISRRLSELRDDGLIEQGTMRACSVNGHQMLVWNPAVPERPGTIGGGA